MKMDLAAQQNADIRERRDALADRVIGGVTAAFQKLAECRADIVGLWSEFDHLKPGETIKGCRTKSEFAEVHLRRNIRSVQYMLKGGNPQNRVGREIISPTVEVEAQAQPGLAPFPFNRSDDHGLCALIDAQTRALM